MKILFYINSLRYGGAERVITNLANEFYQNGYECILATSFLAEKEYELLSGVNRIVLNDKRIKGFLKRNVCLISSLRKIIKNEKPDVVVSFMAEPNIRSLLASIGLKCKNLISVRNDPSKEYSSVIARLLAKDLFKKADGIVFQTADARDWFPFQIREKSRIIYNQVDSRFYGDLYDGERNDIVTVGRLTGQKNQKNLIRAFSLISDKIDDNLVIYGEGPLREELGNLISELNLNDRVVLAGVVKDIPNAIRTAKLFVLSSDYEGLPNALMEAMALGVPCVSTDCPCGGPRELLGEKNSKLLIPVGDVNALATKMFDIINLSSCEIKDISMTVFELANKFKNENVFEDWRKFVEFVANRG